MTRIAVTAKGRVQGVCYRYFCSSQAQELNLSGWVKNQPDGSVYLEAQGEDTILQDLLSQLRIGPSLAEVSSTDWEEISTVDGENEFKIRY